MLIEHVALKTEAKQLTLGSHNCFNLFLFMCVYVVFAIYNVPSFVEVLIAMTSAKNVEAKSHHDRTRWERQNLNPTT